MNEFFAGVEDFIVEHWLLLLVFIFGYFIWKFGLWVEIFPLLGTAILGRIAWISWVHYIRQDFISGIEFVVLEVVPPRDVLRSPKAMELFITNALYHMSVKGGKEEFWQGAVWFWFSLEIVSIEGQVHFYIRTPTRVRGLIETQMYAQYPQAQIKAVEDYTLAVDEISPHSSWMGWGCEFGLVKPEAYPIKTYVDFGLDKDPKEEYKVDPISPVIELFGSLHKGEQMWVQIIVTPSKKTWHTHGTWFGHHDWITQAQVEMDKLLEPYTSTRQSADDPSKYGIEVRAPVFFNRQIEAMEAKTSKIGFDTGIRLLYVAKKGDFEMNSRRNARLIFRQYTSPDINGLNRINSTQADAFGSDLFPLSSNQVMTLADRMLHEYRERSFFHPALRHHILSQHSIPWPLISIVKRFFLPYFHHQIFVLNTEELATLWHFPGQILQVPTLERMESREASPPTNLPI